MREPLLAPLCALAAGLCLARWTGLENHDVLPGAAAFPLLALAAHRWASRATRSLCWLLAIAAAGVFVYNFHRPGPPPELDVESGEVVILAGCVATPPAFLPDRAQFVLELEPQARARVTLYLKEGEAPPALRYGQNVEVQGKVRLPRNFGNPGAFDYSGWLARQDVYWTVGASAVQVTEGRCGRPWEAAIYALRQSSLERLDRLYAGDGWAAGMMKATLVGDTTALEKVWTENFRRTGTYHALVISGLHVTVLAGVLLFVLRFVPLGQFGALLLATALAWLYALMAGMQAPVARAAGGFTLFLIARFFYRRARILNLLAAIAIVFLLADPEQMFEPSFQLSFGCVALIGAFAVPVLEATSTPYRAGLRWLADGDRDFRVPPRVAQFRIELRLAAETLSLWTQLPMQWAVGLFSLAARGAFFAWELMVVSAIVQLGLALPMVVYFHRLSYTGISANLLVVPLMSIVVPVGFFAMITGWSFAAKAAWALLWVSKEIVDWHAARESALRIPGPPIWLAIAFTASIVLVFAAYRCTRRLRWPALVVAAQALALLLLHPFPAMVQPRALELTAIDVGQGESLLVGFPDGRAMIVDGGGFPSYGRRQRSRIDVGEDVVSPYLWTRSIRKLDVMVSTHAHEDHSGGLPALIANFRPRELWTGATPPSAEWRNVSEAARKAGVRIVHLRAGQVFDYAGARVHVLAPEPAYEQDEKPRNNDSLVFRLSYGRHSFLLTGDVERQVEEGLALERTDVLKVAHHGSRTSTRPEFLDAVQPSFALISAGFDNSFRLPHPAVLEALGERNARVLRTDRQGLVTVRSDGTRLTVETFEDSRRAASYSPWGN